MAGAGDFFAGFAGGFAQQLGQQLQQQALLKAKAEYQLEQAKQQAKSAKENFDTWFGPQQFAEQAAEALQDPAVSNILEQIAGGGGGLLPGAGVTTAPGGLAEFGEVELPPGGAVPQPFATPTPSVSTAGAIPLNPAAQLPATVPSPVQQAIGAPGIDVEASRRSAAAAGIDPNLVGQAPVGEPTAIPPAIARPTPVIRPKAPAERAIEQGFTVSYNTRTGSVTLTKSPLTLKEKDRQAYVQARRRLNAGEDVMSVIGSVEAPDARALLGQEVFGRVYGHLKSAGYDDDFALAMAKDAVGNIPQFFAKIEVTPTLAEREERAFVGRRGGLRAEKELGPGIAGARRREQLRAEEELGPSIAGAKRREELKAKLEVAPEGVSQAALVQAGTALGMAPGDPVTTAQLRLAADIDTGEVGRRASIAERERTIARGELGVGSEEQAARQAIGLPLDRPLSQTEQQEVQARITAERADRARATTAVQTITKARFGAGTELQEAGQRLGLGPGPYTPEQRQRIEDEIAGAAAQRTRETTAARVETEGALGVGSEEQRVRTRLELPLDRPLSKIEARAMQEEMQKQRVGEVRETTKAGAEARERVRQRFQPTREEEIAKDRGFIREGQGELDMTEDQRAEVKRQIREEKATNRRAEMADEFRTKVALQRGAVLSLDDRERLINPETDGKFPPGTTYTRADGAGGVPLSKDERQFVVLSTDILAGLNDYQNDVLEFLTSDSAFINLAKLQAARRTGRAARIDSFAGDLAKVAQLGGETGSKLSDKDIDRAALKVAFGTDFIPRDDFITIIQRVRRQIVETRQAMGLQAIPPRLRQRSTP